MATWRAIPTSSYKYGFNRQTKTTNTVTINSAANTIYVATWGNDTTGDGTQNTPYATYDKAVSVLTASKNMIVIGSGVYYITNILTYPTAPTIVGDGTVRIVGIKSPKQLLGNAQYSIHNITYENFTSLNNSNTSGAFTNGILKNTPFGPAGNGLSFGTTMAYTLVDWRDTNTSAIVSNGSSTHNYNTIYTASTPISYGAVTAMKSCILCSDTTLITFSAIGSVSSNNFRNCVLAGSQYKFAARATFTPTGATATDRINSLRAEAVAAFGGATTDYFIDSFNVATTNDVGFNDWVNGDWTLSTSSAFRYVGEFGTTPGAYETTDRTAPSTDFPNIANYRNNVTLNGSNFEITNPLDTSGYASARSKIKLLSRTREINRIFPIGTNAFQNGQMTDSSYNLDTTQITAGTSLTNLAAYVVLGDGITYPSGSVAASAQYLVGERFVALTGTGLNFTGASGASYLRRIREINNRPSILIRYSNGGANITSAPQQNYWYRVATGSVTLDQPTRDNDGNTINSGVAITAGTIFITPNVSFNATGTYNLLEIYSETKSFVQLESIYKATYQDISATQYGNADIDRTYVGVTNPNTVVTNDSNSNSNVYDYTGTEGVIRCKFIEYIWKVTLDNQKYTGN